MTLIQPWPLATLLLIAPLTEEIIFREGLHRALLKRMHSGAWANLCVALVFGMAHALTRQSWSALAVIGPALLIGALYQRTQKLLPCVLLHAAMNACWTLGSIYTNGPST